MPKEKKRFTEDDVVVQDMNLGKFYDAAKYYDDKSALPHYNSLRDLVSKRKGGVKRRLQIEKEVDDEYSSGKKKLPVKDSEIKKKYRNALVTE